VSNTWGRIGHEISGAVGTVTVTGAGSTWTCAGDLIVGEQGTGTLKVLDGGRVTVHDWTRIGFSDSAQGTVTVSGPGSEMTVSDSDLGIYAGSLIVGDGGTVTVSGQVYLSHWATSTSQVVMQGGTIIAPNGVRFDNVHTSLSGYGTIIGPVDGYGDPITISGGKMTMGDPTKNYGVDLQKQVSVLDNSTLECLDLDYAHFMGPATTLTNGVIISRTGLAVDSGITGYGIIVGQCTQTISAPTGTVNMTQTLDVGSSVAHVYSVGMANLGTLTTIAGGQLIAPNGVRFGQDDLLSGYGTVMAGVVLDNGVISATPGQTLTIAGSLSGRGVLVGNVNSFINTLSSNPSGTVTLSNPLDVGNQTARVYSQGPASLGPAISLAGGSIIAANGLAIAQGSAVSGFGTVNANIQLAGGAICQSGGGLTINGRLSGYGLLYGTPSFTTVDPASATVVFDSPMNTGGGLLWLYSKGPPEIRSTLTLGQNGAGTDLAADNGILITAAGTLAGYGSIQAPLTNAGLIAPSGSGLAIASTLTLNGGSIEGSAIRFLAGGSFSGSSAIKADVSSDAGSTITATGPLDLGNAANSDSVHLAGKLDAGMQTVALHSASPAVLAGQTLLTGGRITAPSGLLNSGTLTGHGVIDAAGGFTNSGYLTSSGVTDVYAPVTNTASGKITVTGGGPATFYNAVENDGDISVSQASIAVFLDSVTGSGTFSGTGTKIFESGSSMMAVVATPGNTIVQPAAMVSASSFRENALTVRGRATINPDGGPDGTSLLNTLQIDPGGCLDLKNNDMVLLGGNYVTVRQWILDGRLTTTGTSLSPLYPAALAPVDNNLLHATDWNGLPISDGSGFDQVMVKYTYLGDTNLDGQVTDADLDNVIAHMGQPGTWFQGDVNLDGTVTLADFEIVEQHLGAGVPALGGGTPLLSSYTVVPEPGAMALLAMAGMCLLRRGRRA
jgi:T5SS/PEP-CTERM-associated repeat protein